MSPGPPSVHCSETRKGGSIKIKYRDALPWLQPASGTAMWPAKTLVKSHISGSVRLVFLEIV